MRAALLVVAGALLAACSSTPESERPLPLPTNSHEVEAKSAWSQPLGAWQTPPEGTIQPALLDGRLAVVDGLDWLRGLDARTGRIRWERRTELPITAAVTAADDALLVGTREGEVIAYTLKDGDVRWRTTLSSEILAQPTVAGDMVIVRSGDGKVYALKLADGKKVWTFDRAVPTLSLRGVGRAVVDGNEVFVGFASGKLAALSLKDGSLLWESTVATPQGRSELERLVDVDAAPVVRGDTVYAAAYQGRVAALSRDGGRVLWSRDLSVYNDFIADDHALYLSDDHGAVWAIDRASGAALWKQERLGKRRLSAPVLFGGYLVVADFEGYLHFLARDDGRLVGRYHVADAGVVGMLAADKLLYVQGRDGGVMALRYVKTE